MEKKNTHTKKKTQKKNQYKLQNIYMAESSSAPRNNSFFICYRVIGVIQDNLKMVSFVNTDNLQIWKIMHILT